MMLTKEVKITLDISDWDEINSLADAVIQRNLALGTKTPFPVAQDQVINGIVQVTIQKFRMQKK